MKGDVPSPELLQGLADSMLNTYWKLKVKTVGGIVIGYYSETILGEILTKGNDSKRAFVLEIAVGENVPSAKSSLSRHVWRKLRHHCEVNKQNTYRNIPFRFLKLEFEKC